METGKVHAIYFSPARSTKRIVKAVAQGVDREIMEYDITQGLKGSIHLSSEDVVVIGVPSYSGRVPQ